MPKFVRVKVKATKAEITIAESNVNSTVTVLDKPALRHGGPAAPKPHKNLSSPPPAVDPPQGDGSDEESTKSAPKGRTTAGESGTEEGSK